MKLTLQYWPLIAAALLLCGDVASGMAVLTVSQNEVDMKLGESRTVEYCLDGVVETVSNVSFEPLSKNVLSFDDTPVMVESGTYEWTCMNISFEAIKEGIVTVTTATDEPEQIIVKEAFVVFSIMKDASYETAGMVLGWISTIAWDVSFLPQIWHNYKRQTVSGLSFDFLTFNMLGFTCYFIFNAGMYWIPAIEDQFDIRHPNEVMHVRVNDVVFPLYAMLCTAFQIIQCFIYKKDVGQKVSLPCRIISGLLLLVLLVMCILAPTLDNVLWIDVLYVMSYIKLFISMIKYTPQLYINFKTKSTAGWSIGQVILDFTGGLASLIQMFLIAVNYDDLHSVLTDPTKLGLALLSMFFNVFFFAQHYCLYRDNVPLVKEKTGIENDAYDKDNEDQLKVVVVANKQDIDDKEKITKTSEVQQQAQPDRQTIVVVQEKETKQPEKSELLQESGNTEDSNVEKLSNNEENGNQNTVAVLVHRDSEDENVKKDTLEDLTGTDGPDHEIIGENESMKKETTEDFKLAQEQVMTTTELNKGDEKQHTEGDSEQKIPGKVSEGTTLENLEKNALDSTAMNDENRTKESNDEQLENSEKLNMKKKEEIENDHNNEDTSDKNETQMNSEGVVYSEVQKTENKNNKEETESIQSHEKLEEIDRRESINVKKDEERNDSNVKSENEHEEKTETANESDITETSEDKIVNAITELPSEETHVKISVQEEHETKLQTEKKKIDAITEINRDVEQHTEEDKENSNTKENDKDNLKTDTSEEHSKENQNTTNYDKIQ